jgi:hypothetical protein
MGGGQMNSAIRPCRIARLPRGDPRGGGPGERRPPVIEKVRQFILADEPFSIDNAEMTPR